MEPVTLTLAAVATTAGLVSSLVKRWSASHRRARESSQISVRIANADGEVIELAGDSSAEQIAEALKKLRREQHRPAGTDEMSASDPPSGPIDAG